MPQRVILLKDGLCVIKMDYSGIYVQMVLKVLKVESVKRVSGLGSQDLAIYFL